MAHADYDCCAVCNCKMSYNPGEPLTKEEICSYCLKSMRDCGMNVLDTEELAAWVRVHTKEDVVDILSKIGFSFCYYSNEIDKIVAEKIGAKRTYGTSIQESLSEPEIKE